MLSDKGCVAPDGGGGRNATFRDGKQAIDQGDVDIPSPARLLPMMQGDRHSRDLQRRIAGITGESGVRVLGPNTMGVLNNFYKFSTGFINLRIPCKAPPVSLTAQTGLIQVASQNFACHTWGKAIDIVNACDVDFVDLLEHFENDPETRVIVLHQGAPVFSGHGNSRPRGTGYQSPHGRRPELRGR